MRTFLKRHMLLFLYFLMLVLVSVGLIYGFGVEHLPKVLLYAVSFFGAYFLYDYLFRNKRMIPVFSNFRLKPVKKYADLALFFFIALFVVFHLWFLGHVPFLSAVETNDYYKIAFIRQDIIMHDSTFIKYMSAFMIKGIIPFALVYFFATNKKLFLLLIPFAVFYAISLMQKSLIVSIMVPTVVYALLNRNYLWSVLFGMVSVAGVFVLVYTTNPSLRATQEEIDSEMQRTHEDYVAQSGTAKEDNSSAFMVATDAIYTRVFLTTGLVMGHWFENIPSKYPYAKGCGYHFLAPMLGCNYEDYNYSRIIYDATYAKESSMGLKGTITVASFVYDYANFGYLGLIYSGFILAFFFLLLNKLFSNNFKWNVSLNALFIFWLTSGALSTMLFSGGWMITLLLFFLYKPYIEESAART